MYTRANIMYNAHPRVRPSQTRRIQKTGLASGSSRWTLLGRRRQRMKITDCIFWKVTSATLATVNRESIGF